MDSKNNPNPSDFSWSEFEQLEELEQFQENLDQLMIPDATYRQLKELNQALIAKAISLAELESDLKSQIRDFELMRDSFNAMRLQSTQESTEARLLRLVKHDQGQSGEAEIDFIEVADPASMANPATDSQPRSNGHHNHLEEQTAAVNQVSADELEAIPTVEEIARFQKSAQDLREKSEVISAVFIELDQMVRDLNRQQELLDELKVNQNPRSASELDLVNDKLRRRFRRLSKQINLA